MNTEVLENIIEVVKTVELNNSKLWNEKTNIIRKQGNNL